MQSLHNVQGERHTTVPRSAKHGAMANESSGFVRGEGQLGRLVLADFGREIQFLDLEPVSRI